MYVSMVLHGFALQVHFCYVTLLRRHIFDFTCVLVLGVRVLFSRFGFGWAVFWHFLDCLVYMLGCSLSVVFCLFVSNLLSFDF